MKNLYKVKLLPIERKEDDQSPILIVGSDLLKQTNTSNGQSITFISHQANFKCIVRQHSSNNSRIIYCSKSFFEQLLLPETPLNLYLKIHNEKNAWEFGPFIGIATDQINDAHFGTIDNFLKELQLYAFKNHLLTYVFHYSNFLIDHVKGAYYNPLESSWHSLNLPIPHVIHNRIHSRLNEKSAVAQSFFNQLARSEIPYFNEHFLNKWDVYQLLLNYDHLKPYLPNTFLLNGKSTIEMMIDHHDILFLKPVNGSQGKKIYRIKRDQKNFLLDYTTFSNEVEKEYSSIHTLYDVIRPQLQKQRYIIQEGLQLLTYEERPLDFRFLCHQNQTNSWDVTSTIARVSSKNEFVSNLSRGGEILKTQEVLQRHFDNKTANQLIKLLHELAIEIAAIIQRNKTGIFGELGIDLAIDHIGKPWLIEVNTKPSKNQDSDYFSTKIRPSAKAIIDYCHHLTDWKL